MSECNREIRSILLPGKIPAVFSHPHGIVWTLFIIPLIFIKIYGNFKPPLRYVILNGLKFPSSFQRHDQ